jgi:hypothetical protein
MTVRSRHLLWEKREWLNIQENGENRAAYQVPLLAMERLRSMHGWHCFRQLPMRPMSGLTRPARDLSQRRQVIQPVRRIHDLACLPQLPHGGAQGDSDLLESLYCPPTRGRKDGSVTRDRAGAAGASAASSQWSSWRRWDSTREFGSASARALGGWSLTMREAVRASTLSASRPAITTGNDQRKQLDAGSDRRADLGGFRATRPFMYGHAEPDASPLMRPVRLCPATSGAPGTIALDLNEYKRSDMQT